MGRCRLLTVGGKGGLEITVRYDIYVLSPLTPDLGTLDLLSSVAELGSLGQAAIRHQISQPAVSLKMKQLEQRLGLRLLNRNSSGTELTPSGQQVLMWAQKVLVQANSMMSEVSALRAQEGSRLRVAASFTIAEYLLGRWIGVLNQECPDLTLTLEVTNSAGVLTRVINKSVDLGFVEGTGVPPAGLVSQVVAQDHLVVVVDPKHPWARRGTPIKGAELASTEIITRELGSGTRAVLEAALAPWGGLRSRRQFGSTAAILNAAREGSGTAVVSRLAAEEDLRVGRLVLIQTPDLDLTRDLEAVWVAERTLVPLAKRLLQISILG